MIRSDEQIKKDIVDELYWDTSIDASKVSVTVDHGVVTLTGEVPTYGELTTARSAAWRIEGVLDVMDNLTVSYVMPPELPSDTELRTRVINILTWEPAIDETELTASVTDGIVTVEGTVDSYWKRPYVENRIAGLRGVLGIENRIAVVPTRKMTDEVVAQDVTSALKRDVLVDPRNVTVAVTDGIVTLTGSVPGWASRHSAERDAANTAGVVAVRNELKIAA